MSYTHLSMVERSKVEILHQQGKSSRVIAKELGRHPSTICRELERAGSSQPYHAQQAQNAYQERRKVSIPNGKCSLAATLEEKLQATWSPEQISERFHTDGLPRVSFKTIYRWLYEGRLVRGELQVLRHKGKRRKPTETRGKFTVGRIISDRPKEVRSRQTFGHWELDTVVSGRGKCKGCIATPPMSCTFILPIRTLPGNVAPMKMGTDYCENFTPRAPISLKYKMKIWPILSN